jgi:hypothetical protein
MVLVASALLSTGCTPPVGQQSERCARRLQGTTPSQLVQRSEVISLPGSAGRALSAATAAGLSDWLLFLTLACLLLLRPLARYR